MKAQKTNKLALISMLANPNISIEYLSIEKEIEKQFGKCGEWKVPRIGPKEKEKR